MTARRDLYVGQWRRVEGLTDYRTETFPNMLAERAMWTAQIGGDAIAGTQVAGPGYVWFRFWLEEQNQLVEKYFDETGRPIGLYAPICTPLAMGSTGVLRATPLHLALWLEHNGRLLVLGEPDFEAAVAGGAIDHKQAAWAESQIRALTAGITQTRFPPAVIRNLTIAPDSPTGAEA